MGFAAKAVDKLTPSFVKDAVVRWAKASPSVRIFDVEQPSYTESGKPGVTYLDPYGKSVWVYKCVRLIAESVAKLPVIIYRDYEREDRDDTHPALSLFRQVDDRRSEFMYWEHVVQHMLLLGVSVTALERSRAGAIAQMSPLFPQWLERDRGAKYDAKRGYRWKYGQGQTKVYFWDDELVRSAFFNPNDPSTPLSPLEALKLALNQDYYAQQTNLALFENGALPDAILHTDQPLDQTATDVVRNNWKTSMKGPRNSHRVAVLPSGLSYQEIQRSMRDMEFIEGRDVTTKEILGLYGVPPVMVGFDTTNYATAQEQRRMFWNDTVGSLCEMLDDFYTERFRVLFPDRPPVFGRDKSAIQSIISEEAEIIERHATLLANGYPLNRVLEKMGEEPVAWGDEAFVPWNMVTASSLATGSAQRPATQAPAQTPEPDSADDVQQAEEATNSRVRVLSPKRSWPNGFASMKSASQHALIDQLARPFEARVRDLLGTLRHEIEPRDNPFDLNEWRQEFATKGEPWIGDMIWAAWQREAEVFKSASLRWVKDDDEAATQLDELQPQALIDSPYATQYMKQQTQRFAETVPDTVWQLVRNEVARGIAEHMTDREIADLVDQAMGSYMGSHPLTIARTEAHAAANGGTHARWRDGGEVASSTWSATGDGDTRDAHREASGQTVPLNQPFVVGGEPLRYPGDPRGSASNIIRCRCIALPNLREL